MLIAAWNTVECVGHNVEEAGRGNQETYREVEEEIEE